MILLINVPNVIINMSKYKINQYLSWGQKLKLEKRNKRG